MVTTATTRATISPTRATTENRTENPISSPPSTPAYSVVLEAGRADLNYWRDLWLYREVLLILAWRDVAVRYKQTVLGLGWAVIRPALTLLIFTVLFGRVAKLPTEGGAPYAVIVLAGMLPWFLFSSILSDASNSLVLNANLIGKVYFPRILVPLSASAVAFVDFVVSLVLLVGMIFWTGAVPTSRVLFLPFFVLLAIVASIGPSLYLAALNAKYRDFRYVVPFLLQIGLYASPVGYSSSVVPAEWRLLFSLNPLVGVIDGFRWCLVAGPATLSLTNVLISAIGSTLFLIFGIVYFRRAERSLADLL